MSLHKTSYVTAFHKQPVFCTYIFIYYVYHNSNKLICKLSILYFIMYKDYIKHKYLRLL